MVDPALVELVEIEVLVDIREWGSLLATLTIIQSHTYDFGISSHSEICACGNKEVLLD